jgi:hypothetical protein
MVQATRSNDAYAWGGHYNFNRSYTSNGLNQYTASGSVTPSYDANGNLTSDGRSLEESDGISERPQGFEIVGEIPEGL